ncbi:hypothetical protein [Anthocerotibacter panamensis]|uniref:hypothetical protein n=1 Tax=Anthocerotibacter panamensis TaxID=2857077 RepID=UPI001C40727E|nr:hypothetical protein [Anthocerotibacter panamensis]
MSTSEQQVELKIQRGIRQREGQLVEAIESALNAKKYGNLEEAQFRNLVRVAETTDSPEVIANFLRYQVGRDQKWGRGKDSLAEQIIDDIRAKIDKLSNEIAQEAKDNAGNQPNIGSIRIELIRRYLGYGARHLKYLREGKKL